MAEDAAESSVKIVAMHEDVGERESVARAPKRDEETLEGGAAARGWALVGVGRRRPIDVGVGGANGVRTIGAVDANSAFAFANCPLERVEKEASDEED